MKLRGVMWRVIQKDLAGGRVDAADDVAPLLTVLGAVSAVFWSAMLADKIGPLLQTTPVVEIAKAHATALILVPAISSVALGIVVLVRFVVGPFNAEFKRLELEFRSGAVAVIAWIICALVETILVKLFW